MVLDRCDISLNKNTLHTDVNPIMPMGIRVGTPAMTTRGFDEKEFDKVADLLDEGVQLASTLLQENQFDTLKEFKDYVNNNW